MPRKASSRPYPDNLPGVPLAMLAKLNGISERHARRLRAHADPAEGRTFISMLTPAATLALAHARSPQGQTAYWTWLAMAQYRSEGLSTGEIANLFRVSLRSVGRALSTKKARWRGFNPLGGERILSHSQKRFAS